ncbi:unnamed protein product, partial [Didymodactylos carnosus]
PVTKEKAKHRTLISELSSKVLQGSSTNNNNSNGNNNSKDTLRKRPNERAANSNNTHMNVQALQQPVLFTVKVDYAYNPVHPDELAIKPNDVVNVIRIVEDGWNEGELNGKTGLFPTNYVTRINNDSTNSKAKKDPVKRKTNGVSTLVSREIPKPSYIPVTPSSFSAQIPFTPSPPLTMKKNPLASIQYSAVRARVLYAYNQSAPDELTLNVGDIINVLEKNLEDEGWWKGEINGKVGVFPDNYVEEIIRKDRPNTPETQKYESQTLPKTKMGNGGIYATLRNSTDTKNQSNEKKTPATSDDEDHLNSRNHYAEINNLDAIANTEKLSNFSKPQPLSSKRPPSSSRLNSRYKERPLHSPSPPQTQRDPSQLESPRSRVDFNRTLNNHQTESLNHSLSNNNRENNINLHSNNSFASQSGLMNTSKNSSYVNTTSSLQHGQQQQQSPDQSLIEQLQKDLEHMKMAMELMRGKFHNKLSTLVNELDDEKKVRSKLQIELERVQKTITTSGLFDKVF